MEEVVLSLKFCVQFVITWDKSVGVLELRVAERVTARVSRVVLLAVLVLSHLILLPSRVHESIIYDIHLVVAQLYLPIFFVHLGLQARQYCLKLLVITT